MNFEEAKGQVNSLYGALSRDDLRMQKCTKSDKSFDLEIKGTSTEIIPK